VLTVDELRGPNQFLGIGFLLIATVVALLPAGQLGAAGAEETSGRLGNVLSGPTRRANWFLGRLGLSMATIVTAGLLGGVGTWVGARLQGLDLGLGTLLGAGLNVIPTALLALGIGSVVLSVAPRIASVSVYSVLTWPVFVDLLAPILPGVGWAQRLSLFHYLALVPGQDAEPRTVTLTATLGILLCIVATVVFGRRDLRSI
jgi:ABC-2 type transport system permease protein